MIVQSIRDRMLGWLIHAHIRCLGGEQDRGQQLKRRAPVELGSGVWVFRLEARKYLMTLLSIHGVFSWLLNGAY